METIMQEGRFFLLSLLTGIVLLFLYDFFRILRLLVPHKKWLVFWEDYLFWLLAGVGVFVMIYQVNNGTIRGFSLLAILLGMLLYHYGPSMYWVRLVTFLPLQLIRLLKKIR